MSSNFLVDFPNVALTGYSYLGTISSATTTTGTGVDMQLTDGPVTALVVVGDYGDASTTAIFTMTESDTISGSYTLISGQTGVTLAASASVNDNTVFSFKADKRSKRWVRIEVVTNNAGTPSVPLAVALFARKKISGTGAGYFTATS